ncbi:hypothetical protein AHFPHNDE_01815 [Pseudomonas sp. MM227]|uniref:GNAT family N-acetyltransferase n=1 Tax=unclassified Pseudomonas TaxID=196821 RepID=UPI00177E87E5|nr:MULTISPECIES: GNAT family N-acetyltransferase [unclassified Pseudomonas]MBD8593605.1 GNAT family N-acetyltransferase [Pseudomonas sp. CFBP 8758]MBD8621615.1 GNAT family N-acetyltransferase [Pseudomonas sp. CFBP 13727]CAI3788142.1 hypothetical protein AHFPHNDE_01815 [Pseudomonas sp. MM227]
MNVLTPYPDLSPTQLQQLMDIEIRPEQKQYSGDVDMALYTLLGCTDGEIQGFALLVDEVPKGFLLLKHGRFVPEWAHPQAATLHALQVDRRMQGRGLGRACLEGLPDAARGAWPGVQQLELSVDADNVAGIGLYKALGWVDRGEAYRGRIGYERRFVLAL